MRKIVDGVVTRWPGVTYLLFSKRAAPMGFEPFAGFEDKLLKVKTQDAPVHEFYSRLDDFALQAELEIIGWTLLPFPSFHSTLLGAIDVSNFEALPETHRETWRKHLQDPASALLADQSPGVPKVVQLKPVRMRFLELDVWGDDEPVIVAKLVPDISSESAYAELVAARNTLDASWQRAFDKPPASEFVCHISFAYGKDASVGSQTRERLKQLNWRAAFILGGFTLAFDRAALFGFISMETFFCRKEATL